MVVLMVWLFGFDCLFFPNSYGKALDVCELCRNDP